MRMVETEKNRNVFILFAATVCFYAYGSAGVSWLWSIPVSIRYLLMLVVSIFYITSSKPQISPKSFVLILLFICYCFVILVTNNTNFFYGLLSTVAFITCTIAVVTLPLEKKRTLFKYLNNCMVFILTISIPAWLLYINGFPLPHGSQFNHENGFHILTNYFFFLLNGNGDDIILSFDKFCSIFLEPGQLATPCAFLFFANGGKLLRYDNILYLLAIAMSFSLIAYGLIIGGLLWNSLFVNKKHRLLTLIIFVSALTTLTVSLVKAEDSDNPLYTLIIARLAFDDEKGIVGNNRTTDAFDYTYDKMMKSNSKWFGISDRIGEDSDLATNCSGYKKTILFHGIVGLSLLFLFVFAVYKYNVCSSTTIYFIIAILAHIVRDLLGSPLWLYIILLGMYVLKDNSKNIKLSKLNQKK